jgi:phosphoribosylformylglycinamidine synthase
MAINRLGNAKNQYFYKLFRHSQLKIMILFFRTDSKTIIALRADNSFQSSSIDALEWLFSNAKELKQSEIIGTFIGPRREMITPWSTTAVEITRNMNIDGISRIEEFFPIESGSSDSDINYDKMLQRIYHNLDQDIFTVDKKPEPIEYITDFEAYNQKEGLALSSEEISYLQGLSSKLNRALTDSEVFGFSQVNSEHCRHKIFNGTFIIDGKEMESSLFKLIKKTSKEHPGRIISAYKDNCAFIEGPTVKMFYPASATKPDFFKFKEEKTVISLKAETHNFPTTVEPFNGAATGSGGEIRDRIAGGKGSFPIAGTAVYMTSYPRFEEDTAPEITGIAAGSRQWEHTPPRKWLYQTPQEILIKASNGASDFGNKFGQPVICGSLQTMEHSEVDPSSKDTRQYGYDKVIMLAGGIGFAKMKDSLKEIPEAGDKIILLGGDNYRIGMGGGAVSSVATGEYNNSIELNAVQRSNPEMQKRAYNAIRALAEKEDNTIISVHDHGAGGHLNCLSELVEERGGNIDIEKLPVGDPTLSAKEIIGNESQERMGLVLKSKDVQELREISERERAPFYVIGETTGKGNFTLRNNLNGETPIDLELSDMFGSTPKTVMSDSSPKGGYDGKGGFAPIDIDLDTLSSEEIIDALNKVLQIESVACKDWLTNKVDRSVTGLIACQQSCGPIELPLNNLGVTAIGYKNKEGIATSIGHAPLVGMINPASGSRIAISEALTNIIWTPIQDQIEGVSLSANWMWPCKNEGENSRLYQAVKGASDFAIALGVNIPTGKDSMSMTQKYPNGDKVLSPGTLIVSAAGQCSDVGKTIHPVLKCEDKSLLFYIPFSKNVTYPLGGSAFAQTINKIGDTAPDIEDPQYFKNCFNTLQDIMFHRGEKIVLSGHDVSAGGLVTTLLEMCFSNIHGGLEIDLSAFGTARVLFSEAPAVVVQIPESQKSLFLQNLGSVISYEIGHFISAREINIKLPKANGTLLNLNIDKLRDIWFRTSYLFDIRQVGGKLAAERFNNYKKQPLQFHFPKHFTGKYNEPEERKIIAAIIREKGSNGDREMANALYKAGFRVKDVHVTDLTSGRETLDDVKMIVFVGGFSNADTLGSAKGWAGALLYNEKAKNALERFYSRKDTLSLGVCNGCQLMAEMGFITPQNREDSPKMKHNDSHKYESAFVGVTIPESPSILLSSLKGAQLGIWVAHGEGKFSFPKPINTYNIALKYLYNAYPANPNGSPEGIAAVCSPDGRHLAMMPHPERGLNPWNWPYYPEERENDEVSPWMELFINGRKWLENNKII